MLHVCFSEDEYQKLLFAHKFFSTEDQFCYLADDLSFGDIQNISDSKTRKIAMQKFLGDFRDSKIDLAENYSFFSGHISQANEITIWYDDSPRDLSGFLYTLSDVVSPASRIYTITIDNIPIYLSQKEEIGKSERLKIKELWNYLIVGNSPLRVSQNKRIENADITYYDSCILQFSSENPKKVADVLGMVLSFLSRTEGISVNDGFLAMRVKKLIEDRVFLQTKCEPQFYESLIMKNPS